MFQISNAEEKVTVVRCLLTSRRIRDAGRYKAIYAFQVSAHHELYETE